MQHVAQLLIPLLMEQLILDMECFDDACTYDGTDDNSDGQYTAETGEIPGTDWQYVDGVTSKISSTDASGVTRSTDVVVVITDTLLLCAPSTCMSAINSETGTTADKSFMMAQTFPTVIDTGGKTPTNFYVNFQMSTGTLFDVSAGDCCMASRTILYGNGSRILKVFYINKD